MPPPDPSADPQDSIAAMARRLADAAHELGNPLAIVAAQAELLELETAGTPAADRAARIRVAALRAAAIAKSFLAPPGDAPPGETVAAPPTPVATPRTALVVDDEPELAESLADLLRVLGFAVTAVTSGAAAQAVLLGARFDLIVSDLRMPDIDGPALFAWLVATRPALVPATAFSTGDTLSAGASRFLGESGRPYMEKPFTLAAVRTLVAAVDAGRVG